MKTIFSLILTGAISFNCAAQFTNTNAPATNQPQSIVVCMFAITAVAAGGLAIIYISSQCPDCREHCWELQKSPDEEHWRSIYTNTFSVCNGNNTNIFSDTISGKQNFYRLKRCD